DLEVDRARARGQPIDGALHDLGRFVARGEDERELRHAGARAQRSGMVLPGGLPSGCGFESGAGATFGSTFLLNGVGRGTKIVDGTHAHLTGSQRMFRMHILFCTHFGGGLSMHVHASASACWVAVQVSAATSQSFSHAPPTSGTPGNLQWNPAGQSWCGSMLPAQ